MEVLPEVTISAMFTANALFTEGGHHTDGWGANEGGWSWAQRCDQCGALIEVNRVGEARTIAWRPKCPRLKEGADGRPQ